MVPRLKFLSQLSLSPQPPGFFCSLPLSRNINYDHFTKDTDRKFLPAIKCRTG